MTRLFLCMKILRKLYVASKPNPPAADSRHRIDSRTTLMESADIGKENEFETPRNTDCTGMTWIGSSIEFVSVSEPANVVTAPVSANFPALAISILTERGFGWALTSFRMIVRSWLSLVIE